jgi:Cu(I)/Ag(I) efflux system membrane fusion protein
MHFFHIPLAFLVFIFTSFVQAKQANIEQLFNVRTVAVTQISTAKEEINYGYIKATDQSKTDVHAWFSGYVISLYADKIYSKVKKGDALAKVYSAEVYKAKQDYLHSLHFNDSRASASMLESAKVKLRLLGVSTKEITAIKHQRKASEYTTIYAPTSGYIWQKNINKGSRFTSQKKLFQILSLDKVWLEMKLFDSQVAHLDSLVNFRVSPVGLSQSYTAQKSILYPKVEAKEATYTLRLLLDNPKEALKVGMYAKVYASAKKENKLVLPHTAVIRKSGLWYVFLSTEFKGEYEPLEVKVKPLNQQYYEITKGLVLGDKVVDNALFMMDSDAQINSIY